jgi:hypothetical protein
MEVMIFMIFVYVPLVREPCPESVTSSPATDGHREYLRSCCPAPKAVDTFVTRLSSGRHNSRRLF